MTSLIEIESKNSKETNTLNSGDYGCSFNTIVYNEIEDNSVCLDVGCWSGNMGENIIKTKGGIVDGIDVKDDVLGKARSRGYRETYQINLNAEVLDFSLIKNEEYDFIIFADVLEHLINPELVLTKLKSKLKPKGKIVISLPNVAFLINRINLLFGMWNYKEFGTLDKTHLKFYTIKTGQDMVKFAGYKIIKVQPYNQFGILTKIKPLDTWFPNLLSYQFLILGEKE